MFVRRTSKFCRELVALGLCGKWARTSLLPLELCLKQMELSAVAVHWSHRGQVVIKCTGACTWSLTWRAWFNQSQVWLWCCLFFPKASQVFPMQSRLKRTVFKAKLLFCYVHTFAHTGQRYMWDGSFYDLKELQGDRHEAVMTQCAHGHPGYMLTFLLVSC